MAPRPAAVRATSAHSAGPRTRYRPTPTVWTTASRRARAPATRWMRRQATYGRRSRRRRIDVRDRTARATTDPIAACARHGSPKKRSSSRRDGSATMTAATWAATTASMMSARRRCRRTATSAPRVARSGRRAGSASWRARRLRAAIPSADPSSRMKDRGCRGVPGEDEHERTGDGRRVDGEPQGARQVARPVIRDETRGAVCPDGGIQHGRRGVRDGWRRAPRRDRSGGAFSPASGTPRECRCRGEGGRRRGHRAGARPGAAIPRAIVRDLLRAGVAIVARTISRIHFRHVAARLGRVGAAICTPFRHA